MNKDYLLKEVFSLMERFISKKNSGREFANKYIVFWREDIRDSVYQNNRLLSKEEQEILDELHSDCDCLDHPFKEIRLSERKLIKIVKEKLAKLRRLNKK